MIQVNSNSITADNTNILNGRKFMISDALATKIFKMCLAEEAGVSFAVDFNGQGLEPNPTPAMPKQSKPSKVATKYSIEESTVDGKKVYRIKTGIFSKARTARKIANQHIKDLPGIYTGEFSFEKDGKEQTFKGWYFKNKKTAEAALATLPTHITPEELMKA